MSVQKDNPLLDFGFEVPDVKICETPQPQKDTIFRDSTILDVEGNNAPSPNAGIFDESPETPFPTPIKSYDEVQHADKDRDENPSGTFCEDSNLAVADNDHVFGSGRSIVDAAGVSGDDYEFGNFDDGAAARIADEDGDENPTSTFCEDTIPAAAANSNYVFDRDRNMVFSAGMDGDDYEFGNFDDVAAARIADKDGDENPTSTFCEDSNPAAANRSAANSEEFGNFDDGAVARSADENRDENPNGIFCGDSNPAVADSDHVFGSGRNIVDSAGVNGDDFEFGSFDDGAAARIADEDGDENPTSTFCEDSNPTAANPSAANDDEFGNYDDGAVARSADKDRDENSSSIFCEDSNPAVADSYHVFGSGRSIVESADVNGNDYEFGNLDYGAVARIPGEDGYENPTANSDYVFGSDRSIVDSSMDGNDYEFGNFDDGTAARSADKDRHENITSACGVEFASTDCDNNASSGVFEYEETGNAGNPDSFGDNGVTKDTCSSKKDEDGQILGTSHSSSHTNGVENAVCLLGIEPRAQNLSGNDDCFVSCVNESTSEGDGDSFGTARVTNDSRVSHKDDDGESLSTFEGETAERLDKDKVDGAFENEQTTAPEDAINSFVLNGSKNRTSSTDDGFCTVNVDPTTTMVNESMNKNTNDTCGGVGEQTRQKNVHNDAVMAAEVECENEFDSLEDQSSRVRVDDGAVDDGICASDDKLYTMNEYNDVRSKAIDCLGTKSYIDGDCFQHEPMSNSNSNVVVGSDSKGGDANFGDTDVGEFNFEEQGVSSVRTGDDDFDDFADFEGFENVVVAEDDDWGTFGNVVASKTEDEESSMPPESVPKHVPVANAVLNTAMTRQVGVFCGSDVKPNQDAGKIIQEQIMLTLKSCLGEVFNGNDRPVHLQSHTAKRDEPNCLWDVIESISKPIPYKWATSTSKRILEKQVQKDTKSTAALPPPECVRAAQSSHTSQPKKVNKFKTAEAEARTLDSRSSIASFSSSRDMEQIRGECDGANTGVQHKEERERIDTKARKEAPLFSAEQSVRNDKSDSYSDISINLPDTNSDISLSALSSPLVTSNNESLFDSIKATRDTRKSLAVVQNIISSTSLGMDSPSYPISPRGRDVATTSRQIHLGDGVDVYVDGGVSTMDGGSGAFELEGLSLGSAIDCPASPSTDDVPDRRYSNMTSEAMRYIRLFADLGYMSQSALLDLH
eukprot:CFRG6943T1